MINVFSLVPEHIREKLTLTDDKKQILQQQTISQHTPGTILSDCGASAGTHCGKGNPQ